MKIEIKGIAEKDRGKIKRPLKKAFSRPPAVVITETLQAASPDSTIPVVVSNIPKEIDRHSIICAVDGLLMGLGYRFCNITFK